MLHNPAVEDILLSVKISKGVSGSNIGTKLSRSALNPSLCVRCSFDRTLMIQFYPVDVLEIFGVENIMPHPSP